MNKYFLGLELPEEHKLKLIKAQSIAVGLLSTTKFIDPSQFHITTLFIGAVPRGAAEEGLNFPWVGGAITFEFAGMTVFENAKGPHALVLKLKDVFGNAQQLHKDCIAASPMLSPVKRFPYNPHITLAKCEGVPDLNLIRAMEHINERMAHNVIGHQFTCDHLCLFEKAKGEAAYTPHRVLKLS